MTGTSRNLFGRVLGPLLLASSAIPLVACSTIPMPRFIDDRFPGMFAPDPFVDIQEMETDTEEVMHEATPVIVASQTEDVKHPDIFQSTDMAMWDGRPTLGDIWVSVPDAIQPERVVIRNESTGLEVKGAMFVRQASSSPKDAPIRLSPGAARALGVAPLELAKISVTAIRKQPQIDETTPTIARSDTGPLAPKVVAPLPSVHEIPKAPLVSFVDPYLQPSDNQDGFIEVAQAINPNSAAAVQEELEAASIHAEIQEDYLDGRSVFRVFASAKADHDTLGGTLEAIRFVGSQKDFRDTQIAELPNFSAINAVVSTAPSWISLGVFASRNEAMAMVQRLARKSIPAELCGLGINGQDVFRVFAGPAGQTDHEDLSDGQIEAAHLIENKSFCLGVAAADAAQVPTNTRPVRAPEQDERTPDIPLIPEGAVRIRVGEATGGLKFNIPNPYSEPVQIPVAGLMMSLPTNTPPELVEKIRVLMLQLDETKTPQRTENGPPKGLSL